MFLLKIGIVHKDLQHSTRKPYPQKWLPTKGWMAILLAFFVYSFQTQSNIAYMFAGGIDNIIWPASGPMPRCRINFLINWLKQSLNIKVEHLIWYLCIIWYFIEYFICILIGINDYLSIWLSNWKCSIHSHTVDKTSWL